jgi:hypothetical protein
MAVQPGSPHNWVSPINYSAGQYKLRVEVLEMQSVSSPVQIQFGWWNYYPDAEYHHLASKGLVFSSPGVYEQIGNVKDIPCYFKGYVNGVLIDDNCKLDTDWQWNWTNAFADYTSAAFPEGMFYTLINPRTNPVGADGFPYKVRTTLTIYSGAVTAGPPAITTPPLSQAVAVGQTATFRVAAEGASPLSYQWQKNGVNITGATGASYTTPATILADSGATYRCVVKNSVGTATSSAATLTVVVPSSAIVSDEFNAVTLNTGLWAFINPRNDATVSVSGTQAVIFVPGGTVHDATSDSGGGLSAPRLMQFVPNTNFEVEAKLDSSIGANELLQGIIVEQDGNDYLRFDFYSDGTNTRVFSGVFVNGVFQSTVGRKNTIIGGVPSAAPLYLRVKRAGNIWTLSYSTNGTTWVQHNSFTHAMTVNAIGPYAANPNPAANPPAFTLLVDYFRNIGTP